MHPHTERITHTTTFVTPVVEHWLERELVQNKINSHLFYETRGIVLAGEFDKVFGFSLRKLSISYR